MDSKPLFDEAMFDILGSLGWRRDSAEVRSQTGDWLGRYDHAPIGLALPGTTEEVAAIVKVCASHGVAITPQGGNTGLCGGAVVTAGTEGVILSLRRMNRISNVDPDGLSATVEAGVVLEALHEVVARSGLQFPIYLGSQGSAQIGGLIATNAGGTHVSRYGMMQDLVLGLEVVTAEGDVWDGCHALLKDNAGYQLRRLFCGSEGTLGIITRAVVRLHPAPAKRTTALLALESIEAAYAVSGKLRQSTGEFLAAVEFFTEFGVDLVRRHVPGTELPLQSRAPVYLLVELATSMAEIDLDSVAEAALALCFEAELVLDGTIAKSEAQRHVLWHIREELPEGQRREGPQIKFDVAVPVSRIAAFVQEASAALLQILPGVRVNPFGHFADGNIHFNLSPPVHAPGFDRSEEQLSSTVYELAVAFGGTISAEHGLGQAKIALADRLLPRTERALMRRIKEALDPQFLLNPGKVIAHQRPIEPAQGAHSVP